MSFISLPQSKRSISRTAVLQVQWLPEDVDHGWDRTPRWTRTWRLKVWTVNDIFCVYGDEARLVLEGLNLDPTPPTEGPGG